VTAGDAFGHRYVDLELLDKIMSKGAQAEVPYSAARATA